MSPAQIRTALENEALSDALYKLERFARANGADDLAIWCNQELHGYDGKDVDVQRQNQDFRSVAVQWLDIYNRPMLVDPKLSFINSIPVWDSVLEIEGFAEKGTGYVYPGVIESLNETCGVQLGSAWIPAEQAQALLKRIRFRARAKFDEALANTSTKFSEDKSEGADPSTRLEKLIKFGTTFIAALAFIWLLLEPAFAMMGGQGPLASWGIWRYPALITVSLLIALAIHWIQSKTAD